MHNSLHGVAAGIVLDALTGEPLVGAHVRLTNRDAEFLLGAVTDLAGRFAIDNIPAGMYQLEARMIGFAAQVVDVNIRKGEESFVLLLEEDTVQLSEIVVKPEPNVLISAEAHGVHKISKEQVQLAAQYDEDIYRTVTRLPGLAANDFSSRFSIRGGEYDEVLVTFDGLELNDPFHLKDFGGGGVSIIDAGVIGDVALHTGAFSAEYGDRLSGVFEINSSELDLKESAGRKGNTALGFSLMNARLFSQGALQNRKTHWMISGRRGYLDFLLDLTNAYPSYSPNYFDVFGKVSHRFNSRHKLALQGLISEDQLKYLDVTDPNDQVLSTYGNGYFWANWQAVWNARLYSQTVLSKGRIWKDRVGVDVRRDQLVNFEAADERMFNALQFKQDWTFQAQPTHQIKWGTSIKHQQSAYRYSNTQLVQDVSDPQNPQKFVNRYAENEAESSPVGVLFNLYTSHRVELNRSLLAEAGARFGYATWSNDRYLDPRINFTYQLNTNSSLFAGFGVYHQPQGIEQLYVEDGDYRYYSAERSRHLVAGYNRDWSEGYRLKLDVYAKRNQNLRPRYLSLAGEVAAFFPELDDDRVLWQPALGRSRGLEMSLQKNKGRILTGVLNYTLSNVTERVEGKIIPKSFDQRHAMLIDINLKPWKKFHFNLAWQYHTGWRYSDVDFEVTYQKQQDVLFETHYGALNEQRFPAYHTLNLRMSKLFNLRQQTIAAYIEVRNLYNRQNIRLYSYEPQVMENGEVDFVTKAETWLPRLPSFGLKWEIAH